MFCHLVIIKILIPSTAGGLGHPFDFTSFNMAFFRFLVYTRGILPRLSKSEWNLLEESWNLQQNLGIFKGILEFLMESQNLACISVIMKYYLESPVFTQYSKDSESCLYAIKDHSQPRI